ncbi:unnamed protein product [Rhodiola kirilowii]
MTEKATNNDQKSLHVSQQLRMMCVRALTRMSGALRCNERCRC